jgi:hypothetical protein
LHQLDDPFSTISIAQNFTVGQTWFFHNSELVQESKQLNKNQNMKKQGQSNGYETDINLLNMAFLNFILDFIGEGERDRVTIRV